MDDDRTSDPLLAFHEALFPPVRPQLRPGDTLGRDGAERYEIRSELGRGGGGLVYRAWDTDLDREVAIKVLSDQTAELSREAKSAARLEHPGIVQVYDIVGRPPVFLVMELVRGPRLSEYIDTRREAPASSRRGWPAVPPDEAIQIATQIAEAVKHAHEHGVFHRDIKPDNVLRMHDGSIKLIDFGIANAEATRSGTPSAETWTNRGAGTVGYMAPEQLEGAPAAAGMDLWAIGIVLAEMLIGRLPDPSSSVKLAGEIRRDTKHGGGERDRLPHAVVAVVERATRGAPDERFGSAEALRAELERANAALRITNPYRMLTPFGTDDAEWFFGRDRDVASLVRRLTEVPIVSLEGPSGGGKSSLINAGLIAHQRAAPERWQIIRTQPTEGLTGDLARTIRAETGVVETAAEPLGANLQGWAKTRDLRVLVVIDQYETILAFGDDRAARQRRMEYEHLLVSLAGDHVRVLIVLRDDRHEALTGPLARALQAAAVRLSALEKKELRAMLVLPAERQGVTIEPSVVEKVIDFVSDDAGKRRPAPLVFMQLIASKLWDKRDQRNNRIDLDTLKKIKGLPGVLEDHADGVFLGLRSGAHRRAAQVILRNLVAHDQRRPRSETELRALCSDRRIADETLAALREGRIVHRSLNDDGDPRFDLSHDVLVDSWEKLQTWVEEDRETAAIVLRFESNALDWSQHGRSPEGLWRGRALWELERGLETSRKSLGDASAEFLEAARALRSTRMRRLRRWTLALTCVLLLAAGATALLLDAKEEAAWVDTVSALAKDDLAAAALVLKASADQSLARRVIARTPELLSSGPSLTGRWTFASDEAARLALSADGSTAGVAVGGDAFLVPMANDGEPWRLPVEDAVSEVIFTADPMIVVLVTESGFKWFNRKLHEVFASYTPSARGSATKSAFRAVVSPDLRWAAVVHDGELELVSLITHQRSGRVHWRGRRVTIGRDGLDMRRAAFSPDSQHVAAVGLRFLRIWNTDTGEEVAGLEVSDALSTRLDWIDDTTVVFSEWDDVASVVACAVKTYSLDAAASRTLAVLPQCPGRMAVGRALVAVQTDDGTSLIDTSSRRRHVVAKLGDWLSWGSNERRGWVAASSLDTRAPVLVSLDEPPAPLQDDARVPLPTHASAGVWSLDVVGDRAAVYYDDGHVLLVDNVDPHALAYSPSSPDYDVHIDGDALEVVSRTGEFWWSERWAARLGASDRFDAEQPAALAVARSRTGFTRLVEGAGGRLEVWIARNRVTSTRLAVPLGAEWGIGPSGDVIAVATATAAAAIRVRDGTDFGPLLWKPAPTRGRAILRGRGANADVGSRLVSVAESGHMLVVRDDDDDVRARFDLWALDPHTGALAERWSFPSVARLADTSDSVVLSFGAATRGGARDIASVRLPPFALLPPGWGNGQFLEEEAVFAFPVFAHQAIAEQQRAVVTKDRVVLFDDLWQRSLEVLLQPGLQESPDVAALDGRHLAVATAKEIIIFDLSARDSPLELLRIPVEGVGRLWISAEASRVVAAVGSSSLRGWSYDADTAVRRLNEIRGCLTRDERIEYLGELAHVAERHAAACVYNR